MPARKKPDPIADRMASGWYARTETEAPSEVEPEIVQHDGKPSNQPTVKLVKRTYYLPAHLVLGLERMQMAERERTGERPDLSDLVARAITGMIGSEQDDKMS